MTKFEADWRPISSAPTDVEVETIISDHLGTRNKQRLVKHGRLWFLPDMSMYVYFAPTHWRKPVEAPP